VDRERLADLPGQPPADAPLVCLDTETTGLATAAGTLAFLIGLAWWEDGLLRVVQLLLPDHADEPALLDALADALPPDGWLVTYNGRAFDWPLLVARYRLARRRPPELAGHLDLLWHVRGFFRHRLEDARLQTVERELLGIRRVRDVEGWEIPGRYLGFLHTDRPDAIVDIVRHNETDVASLATLLAHIDAHLADQRERLNAPAGDLAGLGRAYRRAARPTDALACYDAAIASLPAGSSTSEPRVLPLRARLPAWTGGVYGARIPSRIDSVAGDRTQVPAADRLEAERARILRSLSRHVEALDAWETIARRGGTGAPQAWIEVAKIHEHRLRDPSRALEAVDQAERLVSRGRALGRPVGGLEADLFRRRRRLMRRTSVATDHQVRREAAANG
jgi:tetratricopeptide (TPR) repeat protein